jgi:outer membrane protein assembly factor BamB
MDTSKRTRRAALVMAVILMAVSGCTSGPATPDSPALSGVGHLPAPASAWPAAQYDARHSSGTPAIGPKNAHILWHTQVGGNLTPGPVIGTDGSILIASNTGVLKALDPSNGSVRWIFDAGASYGGDLSTSPSVLSDGTILWPGPKDTLFAVSKTGTLRWRETFRAQVLSPAIAGRHRVYVADMSGRLTALRVTGNTHARLWHADVGGPDFASPSVGPDGTIYTAARNALVAITDHGPTGTIKWMFATKQQIEVSSGVSSTGLVVLGTNNDREYGVRPNGTKAWEFRIHDYTYSSSTVRPDGLAYFADNSGRVRTVNTRTGKILRTLAPVAPGREHAWTSIVVDAAGNQYWASMSGHVYAYDRAGKHLFTVAVDAGVDGYPALGGDGTLYVGTTTGMLYAIHE